MTTTMVGVTLQDRVADLLDEAADYIVANGWVQGQGFGRLPTRGLNRPACLTRAVSAVAGQWAGCEYGGVGLVYETCTLARHALDQHLAPLGAVLWNDTRGREEWEVLNVLHRVAKLVRAGDTFAL